MNQAQDQIPNSIPNSTENSLTLDVIEFLTEPGSDFGTQPDDVDSLKNSETLAAQLRLRVEGSSTPEAPERQELRERLRNSDWQSVDWPCVMQELRTRLRLTDGFFAQDLPSQESAS